MSDHETDLMLELIYIEWHSEADKPELAAELVRRGLVIAGELPEGLVLTPQGHEQLGDFLGEQ